ncbi:MAG: DUF6788 family protein, partial [Acidobacteriota bacterium]
RQLATALAQPQPMRRGSLSERTVKCGKPGCPCAQDPKARHGPYYSLTRAVGGRTHSRFLTREQAAVARQQIQAGQQFRARLETYWEDCEAWADSQLKQASAVSTEEAEKGGSRPVSATRSFRKSKRS